MAFLTEELVWFNWLARTAHSRFCKNRTHQFKNGRFQAYTTRRAVIEALESWDPKAIADKQHVARLVKEVEAMFTPRQLELANDGHQATAKRWNETALRPLAA